MDAPTNSVSTRKPTRAYKLCFNADFRGYTHHCSRLMWSEREHGPAAAPLMCANPYVVCQSRDNNACSAY